jgi:transposase
MLAVWKYESRYPVCTYIGLDIHKRYSYAAVVNELGEINEETRIENTKQSLEQFASKYKGAKAVIEATSNYRHIYDVLENYMDVKLANPYKTRAIAEARIKNDRLDAKMLAHLLRTNLIAESYVAREVRELRLTRLRKALVENRTRIKNRIHAILARNGINNYPNPFTKKGKESLENLELSEVDRKLLEINLSTIERINEEIKEIDKIIQEKAKIDGDALLLTTIR